MMMMDPLQSWSPEDDLCLKRAIEAGASFESLAKGAVCFSRKFTYEELSARWRSLLYDRDVSEVASLWMFDFEDASLHNKSNRLGCKEKGLSLPRKRMRSVRSHYYSQRKRILSEPYPFNDFGSSHISETNNLEQVEFSHDKNLGTNSLGPQSLQLQDAGFDVGQDCLTDVLRDGTVIAIPSDPFHIAQLEVTAGISLEDHMNTLEDTIQDGAFQKSRICDYAEDIGSMLIDEETEQACQKRLDCSDTNPILEENINYCCSGTHEPNSTSLMQLENHEDAKAEQLDAFSLPGGSSKSVCPSIENHNLKSEASDAGLDHLEFSSSLPHLSLWDAVEETSKIPNFGKECQMTESSAHCDVSKNLNSSGCDSVAIEAALEDKNCDAVQHVEGDFDDISLNFTNDETFFINMEDGNDLENLLMDSPMESHQSSAHEIIDSKTVVLDCCNETPDIVGFEKIGNEDVQLISVHDAGNSLVESPSHPTTESSKAAFLKEPPRGRFYCPLNIEDPEIPCNDGIFSAEISSPMYSDMVKSDGVFLGSLGMISGEEVMSTTLGVVKEGQEPYLDILSSSSMFGQTIHAISIKHSCRIKDELMESGHMTAASDIINNGLNPSIATSIAARKERITLVGGREPGFFETSLHPHHRNLSEGLSHGPNSKFIVDASMPVCREIEGELVSRELGSEDLLHAISGSEPEDKYSDIEDELPSFSDVEAMILDMDLFPCDLESPFYDKEVMKYKNMDARRRIVRLEQSTKSCLMRTIAFRGAFAVFYGYRLKYYLRKTEVLIGRSTEEIDVDIDLRVEGRANKISRRQAIILMDKDGFFSLKNLGRFPLLVDGRTLLAGQCSNLTSGSLIQIRGMWFMFEVNADSVRHYLSKKASEIQDQSLKIYSFKRELS